MKKAAIIVPTYNEYENVKKLVDSIFRVAQSVPKWEIHVVIVDSDSPDGTAHIISGLMNTYKNLHLISSKKEGLGKAYVRGFTETMNTLNPYVFFEMDADLSHNPDDIPFFLKKIEEGADFVVGSRYIKGGSIPSNWGFHRKVFSICGNLIVRLGFMRLNVTDWTNGFRAVKSWVVKASLSHIKNYSGYVFQIAFLDFAYNQKAVIEDIPIKFIDRTEGESKINSLQYISQMLLYVFTHSPFIKFVITGLLGFCVDFGFAYICINSLHIAKALSNVLSAEIAIIFNFFMNNFWSFKHKKIEGGAFAYVRHFLKFNVVSSVSIFIQWAGLTLLLSLSGDRVMHWGAFSFQSWIIYKIAIIACIIIPYSYILYNKVIWKK